MKFGLLNECNRWSSHDEKPTMETTLEKIAEKAENCRKIITK